jgi:hypothetical protein
MHEMMIYLPEFFRLLGSYAAQEGFESDVSGLPIAPISKDQACV